MEPAFPQAYVSCHSVPVSHKSPTSSTVELVTENGIYTMEAITVVCSTGSAGEASRRTQTKQERRRMQKRESARRKRGKQKQNLLDLQFRNQTLRSERSQLKNQIRRLEANALCAQLYLNTIHGILAITSNQPPPPPPSPSPPQVSPGASSEEDAVTAMSSPVLTQRRNVEVADQDILLWTGESMPKVSRAETRWNQISPDADFRDPISVRNSSLSLQLCPHGDIMDDPVVTQHQTAPEVLTLISTISETMSSDHVNNALSRNLQAMDDCSPTPDDVEDNIFYAEFIQFTSRALLENRPVPVLLTDEQRSPIPAAEDAGAPECLPRSLSATVGMDRQRDEVVDLTAMDDDANVDGCLDVCFWSALKNFT